MFGPNLLKTRVLRGSILVVSTYPMTYAVLGAFLNFSIRETKMVHFGAFWPAEVHFGPFGSANRTLVTPDDHV